MLWKILAIAGSNKQSCLFIGSPGCLAVASTILDLANALFEEVASRSRYCYKNLVLSNELIKVELPP